METIIIEFKNGQPTCIGGIVVLPELQYALLKGKGEGGSITIKLNQVKFKHENTEDY